MARLPFGFKRCIELLNGRIRAGFGKAVGREDHEHGQNAEECDARRREQSMRSRSEARVSHINIAL